MQSLRDGLIGALGVVVLWFAVAAAGSLYGGTGRSSTLDSRESDVTATVRSYHRQGPIGLNGLGYWRTCRATVGAETVELRLLVAVILVARALRPARIHS